MCCGFMLQDWWYNSLAGKCKDMLLHNPRCPLLSLCLEAHGTKRPRRNNYIQVRSVGATPDIDSIKERPAQDRRPRTKPGIFGDRIGLP
mmetsp:Transcript_39520/g.84336  ORF Transcript_39520/g.84336 Transcript_39520/m.84336 type:complete len:89 (+) Transcript_39520:392-658(+)